MTSPIFTITYIGVTSCLLEHVKFLSGMRVVMPNDRANLRTWFNNMPNPMGINDEKRKGILS